ncbi:MAG: imidazole glycerol phosphate synthase subunit HisH [Pseudomonadota bacterium]
MLTALIDYESGNLHSAEKAFQRMASEGGAGDVVVTDDPDVVAKADRLVLPGDGAFPSCVRALHAKAGLFDALREAVETGGRPFMGICVGMQLMATRGLEYEPTDGLGWIDGDVVPISPKGSNMKIPHMGWNDLILTHSHPVLAGIETGEHVYFVHSFHMATTRSEQRLAHTDYGGDVTAIVGRDTMIGMQFHPEKSQAAGLRMIANFLKWKP